MMRDEANHPLPGTHKAEEVLANKWGQANENRSFLHSLARMAGWEAQTRFNRRQLTTLRFRFGAGFRRAAQVRAIGSGTRGTVAG